MRVKEKKGALLTIEEQEVLNVLALYDSMTLYHNPIAYPGFFNTHYTQSSNIEEISIFASSDEILKQGGLKKPYSQAFICDETEIADYLDHLSQALDLGMATSLDDAKPIGILLRNLHHAVALIYSDEPRGWKFMNVNDTSIEQDTTELISITDTCLLAKKIISGFETIYSTNSPFVAFNVEVIVTGQTLKDNKRLIPSLQMLHQLHPLTEPMAKREEIVGLSYIAAQNGHAQLVLDLKNLELISINQTMVTERQFWVSVVSGRPEMTGLLANCGADLNIPDDMGCTPVWVAAQYNFSRTIDVLASHHADLNLPMREGLIAPLHIAAQEGAVDAIISLATHGARMDPQTSKGVTPLIYAIVNNRKDAVVALADHGANINYLFQDRTLVWIAAQKGYLDIVIALVEHGADYEKPFLQSAQTLREYAKTQPSEISERIEEYVEHQLQSKPIDELLPVLPKHIASMQRFQNVVEYLETLEFRQKLSSGQTYTGM